MATSKRRGVPTAVLAVVCVLAWLAAWSGRIAGWLFELGALPRSMTWLLLFPHGAMSWVRVLAPLFGLVLVVWLAVRTARRWWLTTLVIVVGAAAAITAPVPFIGARPMFELARPQLDEIANLPAVRQGPFQYYANLPAHLAGVSSNGMVMIGGDGSVFVPVWTRIIDDAGGYWYTPGRSPEGRDMWGLVCEEPTRLDGNWWACGVDLEPSADA